jgi:hypothetical protein
MEDWRLYPDKLKQLEWDECRTARHIGAISLIARRADVPVILQGAKIKPDAESGGARELFYHPLHENRHQNDAIMHFFYYTQTELIAKGVRLPANTNEESHDGAVDSRRRAGEARVA